MYIRNLTDFSISGRLKNRIRVLVSKALKTGKKCEIGVIFVSDKKIREINRVYLNKNNVTDVIAFNYSTNKKVITGEIFLSIEQAKKQAEEFKHNLEDEILFLISHGLLHLLGWKDTTPFLRKKMFKKQRELINACY